MAELTAEGQRITEDVARRYGVSNDAVRTLLEALLASGGNMAQFSHPELGGMGQWSRGGMIMIGDMFNNALKGRVDGMCSELSEVVGRSGLVAPRSSQWQYQGAGESAPLPASSFFVGSADRFGGDWWPSELGQPASTGGQNNLRYACFPDRRRLAIDLAGQVSVYDTGDHWITGFSQAQGSDQTLTFTSQFGLVRLDSLHQVSGPSFSSPSGFGTSGFGTSVFGGMQPAAMPQQDSTAPAPPPPTGGMATGDIFDSIERLAGLREKGFISDEEFATKKAELLRRL